VESNLKTFPGGIGRVPCIGKPLQVAHHSSVRRAGLQESGCRIHKHLHNGTFVSEEPGSVKETPCDFGENPYVAAGNNIVEGFRAHAEDYHLLPHGLSNNSIRTTAHVPDYFSLDFIFIPEYP
jgi:hypothetical protein